MKSFLLITAVTLIIAVCAGTALSCINICKHFEEHAVPGCDLKCKGCKCVLDDREEKKSSTEKWLGHSKYDVSCEDPTTGAKGSSPHEHDKTLAGQIAIVDLFQKDLGCNCHSNNSIHAGNCSLHFRACFFWTSVSALQHNVTSLKLFLQVAAPHKSPMFEAIASNTSKSALEEALYKLVVDVSKFDKGCIPATKSMYAQVDSFKRARRFV